jgi:hypothetical protein
LVQYRPLRPKSSSSSGQPSSVSSSSSPALPSPDLVDALDASDDRDARDVVRAAPDRSASPPSSLTLGLGWQRWIVARSSGLSACAA